MIERKLQQGMTVAQLTEALADYDDDALVVIVSEYGDRSQTLQALPMEKVGALSESMWDDSGGKVVRETAYSDSGLCLDKRCAADSHASFIEDELESEDIVLLRGWTEPHCRTNARYN